MGDGPLFFLREGRREPLPQPVPEALWRFEKRVGKNTVPFLVAAVTAWFDPSRIEKAERIVFVIQLGWLLATIDAVLVLGPRVQERGKIKPHRFATELSIGAAVEETEFLSEIGELLLSKRHWVG